MGRFFSWSAAKGAVSASFVAAILLTGCISDGPGPSPNVTNAPVGVDSPGSEEDFILNAGRRTFFRENSAELDSTAKVTLDKQAKWLEQYPQWRVKVQGFADDGGSAEAQRALSVKRAENVRSYLVARGVAADRMKVKGYGRDPSRLTRDCEDISCKAQNRKVITNLVGAGEDV